MQQKSSVNPRGWALLTLVGGVALASAFFRTPRVDDEGLANESLLPTASGLGRLASLMSSATNPAKIGSTSRDPLPYDFSDFSQQIVPPTASSPTELPAWAPTRSPIDQLISQGAAPPWQLDKASVSTIKPLDPWVNEAATKQQQPAKPSKLASAWPDAKSLPVADSAPALSRSPGSLAGTSQHLRPTSTPGLTPAQTRTPAQPQYVYQPGFHGAAR
ncbi:MAG: hypothetical protein ABI557_13660 [Aureliella sp.]